MVLEEMFEGSFAIFGHGGHLGYVNYILQPKKRRLHIKFSFDCPRGLGGKDV